MTRSAFMYHVKKKGTVEQAGDGSCRLSAEVEAAARKHLEAIRRLDLTDDEVSDLFAADSLDFGDE